MNRYIITDEGIDRCAALLAAAMEEHMKPICCLKHLAKSFRWRIEAGLGLELIGDQNVYLSDLPNPTCEGYEEPRGFLLSEAPATPEELLRSVRAPAAIVCTNLPLGLSTFGVVSVGSVLPH